jgi:hypothetical protein
LPERFSSRLLFLTFFDDFYKCFHTKFEDDCYGDDDDDDDDDDDGNNSSLIFRYQSCKLHLGQMSLIRRTRCVHSSVETLSQEVPLVHIKRICILSYRYMVQRKSCTNVQVWLEIQRPEVNTLIKSESKL